MNSLKFILTIALCLASSAQSQTLLHLTFAQGPPPTGKVYGVSSGQTAITLSVVDSKQVILARQSGKNYQLQAMPGSWGWSQVQQVPANATYLAVTPQIIDEKVTVEVSYSNTEGENSISYTSTVTGDIGEWIPLLVSTSRSNTKNVKVYTAGDANQQLSLKVEY